MTIKKLLGLRKEISKKRPKFVMQDQHKRPDLQLRWRKPKGMHSKMRHGVWGRPASVNVGYRGPAAVRGMHESGLIPVLVQNITDIGRIEPKSHCAILGHVGDRKKVQLLEACKQKKIAVINVKNVDEKIKMITDKVLARKEAKKTVAKRKEGEAKPAKKEAEALTKEQERKEMEKVLTKRE